MKKERAVKTNGAWMMVAALGLAVGVVGEVAGQTVVVPNANATVEGNGANAFPFGNISQYHRYQQVYAAGEFASLPGKVRLMGVRFRPNGTSTFVPWSTTVTMDLRLSVTQLGPDQLGATFASNVGSGETTVLSGVFTYGTQQTGPSPVGGPLEFDILFPFQTPFEYDPAQGNLLLDVERTSTTIPGNRFLDTQNPSGDGVSRVYSSTLNSPTGSVDSFGLVTLFVYEPLSGGCYANCDGSTGAPALNVADFGCFLSKFAAGDPYANCDGSTGAPQLNVADFGCFLSKFAAGCN